MIRKILAYLLVVGLIVAMVLAVVAGVSAANSRIAHIGQPFWRAAAVLLEVIGSILWLLAIVFVATRLSVLIFAPRR